MIKDNHNQNKCPKFVRKKRGPPDQVLLREYFCLHILSGGPLIENGNTTLYGTGVFIKNCDHSLASTPLRYCDCFSSLCLAWEGLDSPWESGKRRGLASAAWSGKCCPHFSKIWPYHLPHQKCTPPSKIRPHIKCRLATITSAELFPYDGSRN